MMRRTNGIPVIMLALLLSGGASALEWSVDVVDRSGPGWFSSMKIDTGGNVHLVYAIQDGTFPLRYSFWDAHVKRWFTMTIAQAAGACSLALDSKDRPHVSWADAGSNYGAKLHHAFWNGASWKQEIIPISSEIIAYYNSIAIGEKDNAVISFYDYAGPKDSGLRLRMRAVMWNGQAWELRTVDAEEGSGKFNSIAADSAKRVHLAYANVSAAVSGLRYAMWNGGAWQTEVVEPGSFGYSVFVTADQEGNPHISYMDMAKRQVKLAIRKNGRWLTEAVDTVQGMAYPDRNAVAFDENGNLYMTYYDSARGSLRLARKTGSRSGWEIETVDSGGSGFTSALAVYGGVVWISYADDGGNALKVARAPLMPSSRQSLKESGARAIANSQSDGAVKR